MIRPMLEFEKTAVIGASRTALFLASGRDVAVFDSVEGSEKSVREYISRPWPTLLEGGWRWKADAAR